MNLQDLYFWGKKKGINIQGTGDFTHPAYFAEIKRELEGAEQGLFVLNQLARKKLDSQLPNSVVDDLHRFVLTVEISCIYKRHDKVRRVHNLVIMPDLESASKLNNYLAKFANLAADGRPTIGLDSAELLKVVLDINPNNLFIPAHIWTPWFAMFGSKSGFDSLSEAFGDLVHEIKAIETGLSSDPYMNWQVKELRDLAIVSFSDAHSPQKLGREATMIDADLNYMEIIGAIKTNDQRLVGTIEFFPEEGKYHLDGHRNCNVSLHPSESATLNGICPNCKKSLTIGVLNRVGQLSSSASGYKGSKKVEYIIPLAEIIAELKGLKSTSSKTVSKVYEKLIADNGNEFKILRELDVQAMVEEGEVDLAKAISQMRAGEIEITPGYDGVYGKVNLKKSKQQLRLI